MEHSYFAPERQWHLAHRYDTDYRGTLNKRLIWCKGTFATQKWGHNLARILRRGLEVAEDHSLLSATALNLKRMLKWLNDAMGRLFLPASTHKHPYILKANYFVNSPHHEMHLWAGK